MNMTKRTFLSRMLLWVIVVILTTGCANNKDTITQAEKTEAVTQAGKTVTVKPDFAEIKSIDRGVGQFSMPICPKGGSLLHSDSQPEFRSNGNASLK
jgi:PBP1b-binding outer membrane lipoprotein LpoB